MNLEEKYNKEKTYKGGELGIFLSLQGLIAIFLFAFLSLIRFFFPTFYLKESLDTPSEFLLIVGVSFIIISKIMDFIGKKREIKNKKNKNEK